MLFPCAFGPYKFHSLHCVHYLYFFTCFLIVLIFSTLLHLVVEHKMYFVPIVHYKFLFIYMVAMLNLMLVLLKG